MILAFQNCGGTQIDAAKAPGASEKVEAEKELSSLRELIESLSASDLSCASDADCEVHGIGSRPCGGSSSAVLVSHLNAELEQIEVLSLEYERKQLEYNRSNQIAGTCEFPIVPAAACVRNVCQLSGAGI